MYICVGPNCWGMGGSVGVATRRCRYNYPRFNGDPKKMPYSIYETETTDAYVDEQGTVRSSSPIKKIRDVNFVGKQRVAK